jgi:hypothetical protein
MKNFSKHYQKRIAELKAEVERLIKAGDELDYLLTTKIMSYEVGHASWQWKKAKNAAKDGRPSA